MQCDYSYSYVYLTAQGYRYAGYFSILESYEVYPFILPETAPLFEEALVMSLRGFHENRPSYPANSTGLLVCLLFEVMKYLISPSPESAKKAGLRGR